MIQVPHTQLEPETLTSVIEAFVLREGTDYGANESLFSTKVEQVRAQLESGKIKLVFDPESESCTLLTDHQFNELLKNQ